MFSLELRCPSSDAEAIAIDLWDWDPVAVSEQVSGDLVVLLAGFDSDDNRDALLRAFAHCQPEWRRDETDWVAETESAWPLRCIGKRLEVAPPWNKTKVVEGRIRVVINPGMASGTGEHPCTQLAAEALERVLRPESRVVDIGAGSGILALAAAQLGAASVLALEPDQDAVLSARENFGLNEKKPMLAAGYTETLATGWSTVTVANISGSVLFAIFDELLRVTAPDGRLILSGFEEGEVTRFQQLFADAEITTLEGWACLSFLCSF